MAFNSAIYWMPLHALFARTAKKKHVGNSTGKLNSLLKLANTIAPLIGGFLVLTIEFTGLFVVTLLVIALSIIPLFFSPDIKPNVDFKIKKGLKLYKMHKGYYRELGVAFADNIVESVFWPLFVFLVFTDVMSIGIVGTLLSIGTVGFILLIGRMSDRISRLKIIKIGCLLMASIWIARFFLIVLHQFIY